MIEPRVVEPLAVGNERTKDRADFQQLIPIAIVARQARGIKAEYQTDARQANLGEQSLKATTRLGLRSRFAQILINEFHPLAWPPQCNRSFHQRVLEIGALRVAGRLHEGRLSNVDVR